MLTRGWEHSLQGADSSLTKRCLELPQREAPYIDARSNARRA